MNDFERYIESNAANERARIAQAELDRLAAERVSAERVKGFLDFMRKHDILGRTVYRGHELQAGFYKPKYKLFGGEIKSYEKIPEVWARERGGALKCDHVIGHEYTYRKAGRGWQIREPGENSFDWVATTKGLIVLDNGGVIVQAPNSGTPGPKMLGAMDWANLDPESDSIVFYGPKEQLFDDFSADGKGTFANNKEYGLLLEFADQALKNR